MVKVSVMSLKRLRNNHSGLCGVHDVQNLAHGLDDEIVDIKLLLFDIFARNLCALYYPLA